MAFCNKHGRRDTSTLTYETNSAAGSFRRSGEDTFWTAIKRFSLSQNVIQIYSAIKVSHVFTCLTTRGTYLLGIRPTLDGWVHVSALESRYFARKDSVRGSRSSPKYLRCFPDHPYSPPLNKRVIWDYTCRYVDSIFNRVIKYTKGIKRRGIWERQKWRKNVGEKYLFLEMNFYVGRPPRIVNYSRPVIQSRIPAVGKIASHDPQECNLAA